MTLADNRERLINAVGYAGIVARALQRCICEAKASDFMIYGPLLQPYARSWANSSS
jgi:hypothetical protein